MSEELTLETNDFVAKALKNAQETHGLQGWCHRNPKHWALTAQHIIQAPSEASQFMRKNGITRKFYYNVKQELLADPECQAIRNAWAAEISAIQFQGIDTFRESQEKYSEAVENGDVAIDGNELFKQAKALQGFNDIHAKLTGNNVQKHVVEHVVTQEEYEDKAAELRAKIAKAKEVMEEKGEKFEFDYTDEQVIEVD
jgi:hypothetical protein